MIGKVKEFYFKNWNTSEIGRVIAENDEWILVNYIPVDYVADGYKLFKKSYISEIKDTENSTKIETVLKLRNILPAPPNNFAFGSTIEILSWIEKEYDIFEFSDIEEESVFIGKKKKFDSQNLIIDFIDSDGQIDSNYNYKFKIDEICVISFESDYLNAIKLLWKNN